MCFPSGALRQFAQTALHEGSETPPNALGRGSRFATMRGFASGDLPPPSPPAEKATTRQDQTGKSSTGEGAGGTGAWARRLVVSFKATVRWTGQDQPSDRLPRAGKEVEIAGGRGQRQVARE